jgi:hypothetical protein
MPNFPLTVKLTGVTFGNAQNHIRTFGCDDIHWFYLAREPENPHDPNAIHVEVANFFMGYIPKEVAKELAPLMDAGNHYDAEFVEINRHPRRPIVGLTVKIVPATPMAGQLSIQKEGDIHDA